MAVTKDDARAQGEQDASAARAQAEIDGSGDTATLPVHEIAAWVPVEYRQAYLDGAASVLRRPPLIEA